MISTLREKLARAIHENYLKNQQGIKPTDDPAMQPWEQLREDLKESNRQQADQIPEKLRAVGYAIRPGSGPKAADMSLTAEEMEKLAHMEHKRWMSQKLAQGWTYGPRRDDAQKLHPCLVPWEQLSESEKDKDRQAVRAIPELLAAAGFEIHRLE